MTKITPQLVDFLLYNLPAMREQCNNMLPGASASSVVVVAYRRGFGSSVERIVVKRATLSLVLDAVERALRHLPQDHRKIYRMKYRAGMSYRQIGERLHFHEDTVRRKVDYVRNLVAQYLQALPSSVLDEFCRQIAD